jgi:hypothetical protein
MRIVLLRRLRSNPELDRIAAAQDDMFYIEDNYFSDPAYIHIDNKPLFMVFGPEEFHDPDEWDDIFSVFIEEPLFLILNGKSSETGPVSSGEYIWVDNTLLDTKYIPWIILTISWAEHTRFQRFLPGRGWGGGFDWSIGFNEGLTFRGNLQKAEEYAVDYLQLITWNDFGEGTMVEPTVEFEFTLLEKIQSFAGISYSKEVLEEIYRLYSLRKSGIIGSDYKNQLDQCFYYFVSLQDQRATALMDSLE